MNLIALKMLTGDRLRYVSLVAGLAFAAMLVTQQAKDSTGWEKTLATMRKWGAPLSDGERDTLRTYLVTKLGPRPAAP